MIKNSYELEVLVNGKPLPEYFHDFKSYVEGKKDSVFTIRLRNNSGERVLFVPTVDGLSVLDGKDGSFSSGGYIVSAYNSMVVDGWRLSDHKVAEFYFSSPEDSYRERKNKGNNLGSIGVAVFREKQRPIVIKEQIHHYHHGIDCECSKCRWPDYRISGNGGGWSSQNTVMGTGGGGSILSASASSGQASGSSMNVRSFSSQELGTGFGKEINSGVTTIKFERELTPVTVMELFYNSRRALEELGIDLHRRPAVIVKPSSFPNESGYCERP